ncbi:MAG: putative spermidine/putrescine transport system permease protein, partial [Gaiellaceae bacterium]|nr:putative spermidine/putrescine transport system permease protein [Gaiellaceae bacterium]
MTEARGSRIALAVWSALVVAFLWLPLTIILVYAFNSSNIQSWPIAGFTVKWFSSTWHNQEVRDALWLSTKAALLATAIALVLGTAAAFAVARFRFFGREAVSFLLVLPLALPGVITGVALSSFYSQNPVFHIGYSLWTIVIGHATFCIVIVFNNVVARLRRASTSLGEASMDLGARNRTTLRRVILPLALPGVVAGSIFT